MRDLNFDYDVLGNLTAKTSTVSSDVDVTGYGYGANGAGPNAVTSATVEGIFYTIGYDNNGAITKYDRSGSTTLDKFIQYNAANQPEVIVVGSSLLDANPEAKAEFRYGPDGERVSRKTQWKEGSVTKVEEVFYVAGSEFITLTNVPSVTTIDKELLTPDVMLITSIGPNDAYDPELPYPFNRLTLSAMSHEYAHRDHLGSLESVTDDNGNVLSQLAFEPYGERKASDWSGNIGPSEFDDLMANSLSFQLVAGLPPILQVQETRKARGFTGHEHLDRTGFIHMNGRVFDPSLGRFLSPDPIVHDITVAQHWNSFSYTANSPLSLVDPLGLDLVYLLDEDELPEIVVVGRRSDAMDPGKILDYLWYLYSRVEFVGRGNQGGEQSSSMDHESGARSRCLRRLGPRQTNHGASLVGLGVATSFTGVGRTLAPDSQLIATFPRPPGAANLTGVYSGILEFGQEGEGWTIVNDAGRIAHRLARAVGVIGLGLEANEV